MRGEVNLYPLSGEFIRLGGLVHGLNPAYFFLTIFIDCTGS